MNNNRPRFGIITVFLTAAVSFYIGRSSVTVQNEPERVITTVYDATPSQTADSSSEPFVNPYDYDFPDIVIKTATGTQFHSKMHGNMRTRADVSIEDAIQKYHLHPCDICFSGAE